MGHIFSLYLVGLVLDNGDLESLGQYMNLLTDFLLLLLGIVAAGMLLYIVWVFGQLKWILKVMKGRSK